MPAQQRLIEQTLGQQEPEEVPLAPTVMFSPGLL